MNTIDLVTTALEQYLSCLGLFREQLEGGAEIILLGELAACWVEIAEIKEMNGGFTAVAKVMIDLDEDLVVEDIILGMGQSAQDAIINSVDQFVGSMVAPIAALSGNIDLVQWRCTTTNFDLSEFKNGTTWNMVVGQVVSNDATGEFYKVADTKPPLYEILSPVLSDIANGADSRAHWIKAYNCRFPDHIEAEVRVDNVIHEPAGVVLQGYKWPTNQPVIWFRQFAILEPADVTEARMRETQNRPGSGKMQVTDNKKGFLKDLFSKFGGSHKHSH